MARSTRTQTSLKAGMLALTLAAAGSASGVNYPLNWLDMSPTPFGSAPPTGSSYFMPGVGLVTITYTTPPLFNTARVDQTPVFGSGSVVNGPDTYNWGTIEQFARTNVGPVSPPVQSWDITYTFPTTLSPGQIVLGVGGLGRRSDVAGAVSTATVLQNGTFLGEYFGPNNFGANTYTGGPGFFTLENSVTGAGGANPHWNTALALVRIDDAISSLTVRFLQASGDGVGLNIAYIPAPSSVALLGLAGLAAGRRRR